MRVRKYILPRRFVDWCCFLLIAIFLPVIFLFELVVVLPVFHESGSFWHNFTLIVSCFLIVNIQGNMIMAMMVDTSVDYKNLKAPPNAESIGWRECKKCDKLAPPRSWHCKACGVCILKRDHHCLFTGCCIGHRNQRYFSLFVFYLLIGATYAFVYNTLFMKGLIQRASSSLIILMKFFCPFIMGVTRQLEDLYIVYYHLNLVALVFSLWLTIFHMPMLFRGQVGIDRVKKSREFDMGLRENLRHVLGQRMWLAMVWPLARSDLPGDGLRWISRKSDKTVKK